MRMKTLRFLLCGTHAQKKSDRMSYFITLYIHKRKVVNLHLILQSVRDLRLPLRCK
jgi:hypothetical protein